MSHEGGESTLRLAQRIYNLLDEIREESDEKTYILVAHNGIARVVQSYFHDMTNEEYAGMPVISEICFAVSAARTSGEYRISSA